MKLTLLYTLARNNDDIDRSRECVSRCAKHLSNTPLYTIAHHRALLKFGSYSYSYATLSAIRRIHEQQKMLCMELLSTFLTPLDLSFFS